MIIVVDHNKVICLIPARGGSKTIPFKNIKLIAGKPLIAWTIDVAAQVHEISRIIVSTDDKQIAEVARTHGAEVMMRDHHLALDDSMPIDVIRSVIKTLKDENEPAAYMLYLEPTSPLRLSSDIRNCIQLITDRNSPFRSVATYTEAELNPHRAWKIDRHIPSVFIKRANPWLPRQQQPKAFQLNGAVYGFSMDAILQDSKTLLPPATGAIIMPKERSIDIDDHIDFTLAELLIKRRIENETS